MRRWWLALACLNFGYAAEPVVVSGRAMGTTWTAKFVAGSERVANDEVRRRIAVRLEELEAMFSTYRAASVVSRFNASRATEWVSVPREMVTVAQGSRAVSELTGGAFDVTVAPLVARWGFGPGGAAEGLPTTRELEMLRKRVGFRKLEARDAPPALRKTEAEVAVDFSSMAKGFAADEMSRVLVQIGYGDHLVQVGGDLKSHGVAAADGRAWTVGVEQPGEVADIAAKVKLRGGAALSTSGNYRNVVVREGRRVGHVIDPRTGWPVESNVVAVSVVHAACAWSSALATGLFVLGAEEGLRVAEAQEIAVLFLVREGEAVVSRASGAWREVGR